MNFKETRYIEFSHVNESIKDSILNNTLVLSEVFYNGSTLVVLVSIDLENSQRVKAFINLFRKYYKYFPTFTQGPALAQRRGIDG